MLQFVSSFQPSLPYNVGPDGLRAYEYVGDGAFSEPRLDSRPTTAANIWGTVLQAGVIDKALHFEERRAEGACAARLILRGLELCAEMETIDQPDDRLMSAKAFRAQSHFGTGVARIKLRTRQ